MKNTTEIKTYSHNVNGMSVNKTPLKVSVVDNYKNIIKLHLETPDKVRTEIYIDPTELEKAIKAANVINYG